MPSDSEAGDWLLRIGKGFEIKGMEKAHNERAQMENYLKELKIGVGMKQMPYGEFNNRLKGEVRLEKVTFYIFETVKGQQKQNIEHNLNGLLLK